MHKINLLACSGKKDCIFYSDISASDDCNRSTLEKCSVAGRAIGYSHSAQFLFSRNSKLTMSRTTCQDHSSGPILVFLCADHFDLTLILNRKHWLSLRFDSKLFCMFYHGLSEIQSCDSRKSRIVIHLISIHDLSALHKFLLKPQSIQLASCRIDRCADSCRSCTQNRQIIYFFH